MSKIPKHTPGPWKLCRINSDEVFIIEDRLGRGEAIPGYNRKLAEMPHWHDDNYQEKMANAQLIATAPELLGALKKYFVRFENEIGSTQHEEVRALIARAEATQ